MVEKRFAVVTGASSGIGYELARQFAMNDFDLLVTSGSGDIMTVAPDFIDLGADVTSFQADLSTPDGVEMLYAKIGSMGRPVDAIALNAGVGVGGDFARQTDLMEELKMIDLNVRSTVHLAKLVLQDMVAQGYGKVLFTSSIAATMPDPFEAVYGATKSFIQSFAIALREELRDTQITITSLMPGPTATNFFHRAHMDDTRVGAGKKDDPALVAEQGFKALMNGTAQIIAGSVKTKAMGMMNDVLPEAAKNKMHRHLSEPGGANPDQ